MRMLKVYDDFDLPSLQMFCLKVNYWDAAIVILTLFITVG